MVESVERKIVEEEVSSVSSKQPSSTYVMVSSAQLRAIFPSTLATMLMRSFLLEQMIRQIGSKDSAMLLTLDSSRLKCTKRSREARIFAEDLIQKTLSSIASEELGQFRTESVLSLDLGEFSCLLLECNVRMIHAVDVAFAALQCAWLTHRITSYARSAAEQKLMQKLFAVHNLLRVELCQRLEEARENPRLHPQLASLRVLRRTYEQHVQKGVQRGTESLRFAANAVERIADSA